MCAETGQTAAVEGMLALVEEEGEGAAAEAAAAVASRRRWSKDEVKARIERRSDEGYRAVDLAALEGHKKTLDLILAKMREVGAALAAEDTASELLERWAKAKKAMVAAAAANGNGGAGGGPGGAATAGSCAHLNLFTCRPRGASRSVP